jgi:hypothetical protein
MQIASIKVDTQYFLLGSANDLNSNYWQRLSLTPLAILATKGMNGELCAIPPVRTACADDRCCSFVRSVHTPLAP